MKATINDAISALLKAEGFDQMAKDILIETEHKRIVKYANVAYKNAPIEKKNEIFKNFKLLGVL